MVHVRELCALLAPAVSTIADLFTRLLPLFCWMPWFFSSIFRFLAIFGFKYSRLPSGFVADRREVSQRPATLPQAGLLPREQEYVHRKTSDGWEDDLPFGMTDSGKNVQRVVMNTLERVWAGACLRIWHLHERCTYSCSVFHRGKATRKHTLEWCHATRGKIYQRWITPSR